MKIFYTKVQLKSYKQWPLENIANKKRCTYQVNFKGEDNAEPQKKPTQEMKNELKCRVKNYRGNLNSKIHLSPHMVYAPEVEEAKAQL
jgi:hypothetical protein